MPHLPGLADRVHAAQRRTGDRFQPRLKRSVRLKRGGHGERETGQEASMHTHTRIPALLVALLLCLPSIGRGQSQVQDQLGQVDFANSCRAAVQGYSSGVSQYCTSSG
jgi:hypothetical protein